MTASRRSFLKAGLAVTVGFHGLKRLLAEIPFRSDFAQWTSQGLGALQPDPQRVIDLPAGFSYTIFSTVGERMDDGFLVPGKHDGMGAFPGPRGKTILVRNHELLSAWVEMGPFGRKNEKVRQFPREKLYDRGRKGMPCLGGTTTLVFDTKTQKLERHYLSLAGTQYNCAGGPTPWNSWISCEENTDRPGELYRESHGYAFEVPAVADGQVVDPVPLKAMGRFRREAIAIDPRSGAVYQTEDLADGLIYRFLPDVPGNLRKGGRLQALALRDRKPCDTRNWAKLSTQVPKVPVGQAFAVEWLDLDEIDSPSDDLRLRGYGRGAARFARGEGMWYGNDAVYFACTNGGHIERGQIWRYVPSPDEGTRDERNKPGQLELFLEPNEPALIDNADNLTVAPWGDLVVCEDGRGEQYLVGITAEGRIYKIARNALSESEFAGATFSPDGTTLFVNLQGPGFTLAITGPWQQRRQG